MQEEVWKDVVGFEQYFMVSNLGRIYTKRSSKILKTRKNKTGYWIFTTRLSGRKSKANTFRVHRLVAEAFLEPPSEDLIQECSKTVYGVVIVRHIDNNKDNNCANNLLWGTYKDNSQDMLNSGYYIPGKGTRGLQSTVAKLTADQVRYIRENYKRGCKVNGCRAIAKKLGVGHHVVSDVIIGQSYKDVI